MLAAHVWHRLTFIVPNQLFPVSYRLAISKKNPLQLFRYCDTWPQNRPVISFFLLRLGGNFINFLSFFYWKSTNWLTSQCDEETRFPPVSPHLVVHICSPIYTAKICETQWRTQENQWGKIEGKVFCTTLKKKWIKENDTAQQQRRQAEIFLSKKMETTKLNREKKGAKI